MEVTNVLHHSNQSLCCNLIGGTITRTLPDGAEVLWCTISAVHWVV